MNDLRTRFGWRAGLSAAIGVGLSVPFARVFWHIGDEGAIVHGAQRWLNGDVPYRDFFEVMGPSTFLPTLVAFRLFGESWWASRMEFIATAAFTAAAMCWLGEVLRPQRSGVLLALLYVVPLLSLWPGVNFHLTSNVFYLAAVACALMLGSRPYLCASLTGFLAGYVMLGVLQKGVLLLAALVLLRLVARGTPLRARLARCAVILGGGALPVLVAMAYFGTHDALGDYLYATVEWPFTQYHTVNRVPVLFGIAEVYRTWNALWAGVVDQRSAVVAGLWLTLPCLVAVALSCVAVLRGIVSWRSLQWGTGPQPILLVTGVALAASELHRPDLVHLLYGAPLLMALGWAHVQGSKVSRFVLTLTHGATACLLVMALLVALSAGTRIDTRVGDVWRHADDPALRFLQSGVGEGQHVFVYPYAPMYYFVGGIRNPTRLSIFMHGYNTPAQAAEIVRALNRDRVEFVLWDQVYSGTAFSRWFPAYRHPPAHEQPVEQYLSTNYEVARELGRFTLLRRRDARLEVVR